MAKEEKSKNTKKIIAIIVGAIVVVAAVVVGIILLNNQGENLSDDYFKTDDTKIVISNSTDGSDPTVAKKVHQVYFVDGDKITGLKVYSEFESEQAAKDADAKPEVAEAMKTGMYKDHKVQGKFIIVTMAESAYQSVTADQIRATATALEEALKNGAGQQDQSQTIEEFQEIQEDDGSEDSDGSSEETEDTEE